jgi:hypothetical protein
MHNALTLYRGTLFAAVACVLLLGAAACMGPRPGKTGIASGKGAPVPIELCEGKSAIVRVNGGGAGRTPCSPRLRRGDRIEILAPDGFRITRCYRGEQALRFRRDGAAWYLSTVAAAEPGKQRWRLAAVDAGMEKGVSLPELLTNDQLKAVCAARPELKALSLE